MPLSRAPCYARGVTHDIARVIGELRERIPGLRITPLHAKFPADDVGLWFVGHEEDGPRGICQLESSTFDFPFLFESELSDVAHVAIDVEEAATLVDHVVVRRVAPDIPRMQPPILSAPTEALTWLADRGAPAWLVRHHELVLEAAEALLAELSPLLPRSTCHRFVLLGAALHDVGKLIHPEEMRAPGHRHELAGSQLLGYLNVNVARVAVTHAAWTDPRAELEDRLVALADKLWKGKRDTELEQALVDELARLTGRERWATFETFDSAAERVAAGGPERLARSEV